MDGGGGGIAITEVVGAAAVLPYVLLHTSNDSHGHRLYQTLAASAQRPAYVCLRNRLVCDRVVRPFPNAVLLCGVNGSQAAFLELLASTHLAAYIFRVYFCQHSALDLATVSAAYGKVIPPDDVLRLQCYPRSVEAELGKTIPMSVDLRMSGFTTIGSVVKLPADQLAGPGDRNEPWRKTRTYKLAAPKKKAKTAKKEGGATAAADAGNAVEADFSGLEAAANGPGVAYLHGVSSAACFYRAASQPRANKNTDRISRAAHKLSEVIDGLGVRPVAGVCPCMSHHHHIEVAGWQAAGEEGTSALPALDIGCAPGGWTKVLSAQPWVSTVVAVDPAGVVPAVAALPGVTVHSTKVELVVDEIRAAGPYGIVCCDANVDAVDALPLVGPALPLLVTGGILVLTVKCPTKYVTRESLQQLEEGLRESLRAGDGPERTWRDMAVHWLLANTENERTMVAVVADKEALAVGGAA